MKTKIDGVLAEFIKNRILKKADMDYQLSFSVSKGVIKVEANNKLIAQEVALRVRELEEKLRKEGVIFKKLLI